VAAQAVKVLVFGAPGVLGPLAVERLRATDIEVRAMSRQPDAAGDLARHGVEVITSDLLDRASLDRACAGVDRVIGSAHRHRTLSTVFAPSSRSNGPGSARASRM
jgi:uncharacterized protein YbjT (DUF2867 family)